MTPPDPHPGRLRRRDRPNRVPAGPRGGRGHHRRRDGRQGRMRGIFRADGATVQARIDGVSVGWAQERETLT